MVSTLRRYVEHESPSDSPEAVAAFVELIASDFAALSPRIRQHKLNGYGPALQIDFPGPRRSPRVLLLGHTDTVYPLGTLETMPWRERAGKLCGPGAFDMKGGIVQALFAMKALQARGPLPCSITLLLVPDEEIGSPGSRALTKRLAPDCSAVLVLEPAAAPDGACKTARKGVARYTLRIYGQASHAGLDYERGASAIVEAARQIIDIHALSRPQRGLTVSPGLISGGTRPNVVADFSEIVLDVRFFTTAQAARADAALRSLRPHDPRCRLQLLGGMERGPFERSAATVRLYRLAAKVAEKLGFPLAEASVGGCSDGNFTSALGIPTLDGLGAVGDGAHSQHEFVVAREMPRRSALLAELITSVAEAKAK
ncbi:MAG: peptidase M20 [Acidobacteria bacterium]|nr:MAG: peptidase M20 [Acidobacteriota bacterium]